MATQPVQYGVTVEQSEAFESREPNHDDIAALAYALWQERGCPIGSPDEDWFRAESELKTSNL